jgi:hypothetical protein
MLCASIGTSFLISIDYECSTSVSVGAGECDCHLTKSMSTFMTFPRQSLHGNILAFSPAVYPQAV